MASRKIQVITSHIIETTFDYELEVDEWDEELASVMEELRETPFSDYPTHAHFSGFKTVQRGDVSLYLLPREE